MDRGAWWATVHGVTKSWTPCAIEHTINQKMKDHINAPTVFGCALSQHQASLVAQLVKNCAMGETWVPSVGWEDALEKGKATYSTILAWRIPWTEQPGGLQSVGSKRVRLSLSLSCPSKRSLFIYDTWPGWLLCGLHSQVREEDAV